MENVQFFPAVQIKDDFIPPIIRKKFTLVAQKLQENFLSEGIELSRANAAGVKTRIYPNSQIIAQRVLREKIKEIMSGANLSGSPTVLEYSDCFISALESVEAEIELSRN